MSDLILIPGLLNDERLWAHQARSLADLATPHIMVMTEDDSVSRMAERVLAQAPARFSLAGLSMGGYVSMEIMRRAPERVERLALVSTTARPDVPEQTQRRQDAIELAKAGSFAKIMPSLLPIMMHPDHVGLERKGGLAKDMAAAVGPDAFIRQQTAIMRRPDSRPSLSRVACPAMVVVGREDGLTPLDRTEEMAAIIPGAKLAVIEDCGHLSAIEQPQAVSAVLRLWLQD